MQSLDRANLLERFPFLFLGTAIVGYVLSIVVGLAFLLVATYLMVGTVGVQIQRESIVGMLTNRRGCASYMRLLLPAALAAISFQVGFIIAPFSSMFTPIGIYIVDHVGLLSILRDVLLMLLWVISVTGLTWLWLAYIRFFSVRLLGTHMGASAPQFARRILTVVSSILLWILYLPGIAGQLQITGSMTGNAEAYMPLALPITLTTALVLYPIVFGATALLVQAYRWGTGFRCSACGQVTRQRVAVGQTCEHCGKDLAPWLFAASPLTT